MEVEEQEEEKKYSLVSEEETRDSSEGITGLVSF